MTRIKVDTGDVDKFVSNLKTYAKQFEDKNNEISSQLLNVSNYWNSSTAFKFIDKVNSDKTDTGKIVDSVKKISDVYDMVYNKFNDFD